VTPEQLQKLKPLKWTEEDDIVVIEKFMTKQECRDAIKYWHLMNERGHAFDRQETGPDMKKDRSCSVNFFADWQRENITEGPAAFSLNVSQKFHAQVLPIMHEIYPTFSQYDNRRNAITTLDGFKIQKTVPGGGYHVWHTENSGPGSAMRTFVFSVYLNDDFEGGETEFLHKSKRIQPKQGSALIFPAGYTHDHRGNPPLTGEKFFLTSWATTYYIEPHWVKEMPFMKALVGGGPLPGENPPI